MVFINTLMNQENYYTNIQQDFNEADLLLGAGKEDVLRKFGKPTLISYNVNKLGIIYEEWWFYRIEKGIFLLMPRQHAVNFYFNNDVCVKLP